MHNPSQFRQGQRPLKEEGRKREGEKAYSFNKKHRVGRMGEGGNVPLNPRAFCLCIANQSCHLGWQEVSPDDLFLQDPKRILTPK